MVIGCDGFKIPGGRGNGWKLVGLLPSGLTTYIYPKFMHSNPNRRSMTKPHIKPKIIEKERSPYRSCGGVKMAVWWSCSGVFERENQRRGREREGWWW